MVAKTLKIIAKTADWMISGMLAFIFFGWLFGYVKTYSLFGKFFLVIG